MSRKQKSQANQKPIIDVVITTGGRFDMLSKCLDALYKEASTIPMSIYIIDNNSPAEEYRLNSELFSKRDGSDVIELKVKHLQTDVGFPASNNEGARMGTAPLIMFLNDDVELFEGSVKEIVKTMDDPTIGVTGIKLLFPPTSTSAIRPPNMVQHVGIALNIRGEAEHPLVGWGRDNPKTNISRDVVAVTGACLTTRRSIFNRVGGFGMEYGAGTWEDVDLCFKVRQSGLRVWVNTNILGYHYVGATLEKKRAAFPIQQNKMIFQTKWGNSGLMAWTDWEFR